MNRVNTYMKRHEIEKAEEWMRFMKELPMIPFPTGWMVQVIPPFAGALARFRVRLPSGAEKSVYFDAHNALGYMDGPYWEVYPVQGDTGRCDMADVDELLRLIADESPSTESEN
jgi:hypothetical protein